MILNTDFKFRDDLKSDTTAIELLTEAYKGVIFRYTNVGLKEQHDGTAVLQFTYDLLDTGKFKKEKLRGDRYFQEHLGLILNTLIVDMVEMHENATRTDNLDESVEEREIFEEGTTLSKE